jgi:2-oxoglutarate ferredoxin oxidoreductase subunit alpha
MDDQRRTFNIVIGGEAGQGLQTVGEIFARALVRSGYAVFVTQTYESRVRGGHNVFAIRFAAGPVCAPSETVDLLVALTAQTVALHRSQVAPDGRILADAAFALPAEPALVSVPFKALTSDGFTNMAALGVAASLLGLNEATVARTMDDLLGKGRPEMAADNRRALASAFRWLAESTHGVDRVPPPSKPAGRLVMNGHDAVALGAISAGVRFCAYYPMSPSTSVAATLTQWAKPMGILVEQVEDEIAALNMAIGAAFAGAPSLVPTSGGGFALMVEAVSLAGITETPVVVLVGQRPGPATGLATRTEQADLGFVLHAGHGEFPRAVFAPGTLEECFHLTRRAFEIAERYQGPVFILTDHFLADSYRDVAPFDVEGLGPVVVGSDPAAVEAPYRRYALTEAGVSPRLLPGMSRHLVVADSHEHTEAGHITEDLTLRPRMVHKRLRKEAGMRSEAVPPDFQGPQRPELLLVCWGSTKGAVAEAAALLTARGKPTAALHFSQVWPLAADRFLEFLGEAKEVVGVEGNATGQFSRLLRQETGFHISRRIARFDGLPMTPEYILRGLEV